MKTLCTLSLLLSLEAYGQVLDVSSLKTLFTQRRATLENVQAGMARRVLTKSYSIVEGQKCNYTVTSEETLLKIDGPKAYVFARESFAPEASPACRAGQLAAYEDKIVYLVEKPSLAGVLADLDASAADVTAIRRDGDLVKLNLTISDVLEDGETLTDNLTVTYDLSKTAFSNLVLTEATDYSISSSDLPAVDLKTIDLRKVFFCPNNDGDTSDCTEGDYSDILY